jgi:hypothetical protein
MCAVRDRHPNIVVFKCKCEVVTVYKLGPRTDLLNRLLLRTDNLAANASGSATSACARLNPLTISCLLICPRQRASEPDDAASLLMFSISELEAFAAPLCRWPCAAVQPIAVLRRDLI